MGRTRASHGEQPGTHPSRMASTRWWQGEELVAQMGHLAPKTLEKEGVQEKASIGAPIPQVHWPALRSLCRGWSNMAV